MFNVLITKMNETKMSNSFKSYVGFQDHEPQSLSTSGDESLTDISSPRFLQGEMLIAEAQNVLMFAAVSEQKQGKSGVLRVTNFRLSFVTSEERLKEELCFQQNFFLGENDVCLSNIDVVFQITGDKRRRLLPGNNVSGKVKGLHILCKNMRVLSFGFKFSPVNHGKTLTNALLHHAYPRRHQLLFAYDFREPYYNAQQRVCLFREHGDWVRELSRTKCPGWRLSAANQSFQLSVSLPQWMVVPAEVLDWQLSEAARHFRASRPPVWCWGSEQGAALVRMADLLLTITDRAQESAMLESVRKSHPQRKTLLLLDLSKDLPSIRDVQQSFVRLRELCAPDSLRQFWVQDSRFHSLVDSSRWLHIVSWCLGKAVEAVDAVLKETTVVIQENEGRDMSTVVSSVAQLLLDPHWRTIVGFQTLLQKDWVAMGHPFCSRLAHTAISEQEQSPIFLVFLDCAWQLTRQFPTAFQYTETYLTTVWDSAHSTIFETFLFDCDRDRTTASDGSNPLILRSVWDWAEQFSEKDCLLFENPLYTPGEGVLTAKPGLPHLQLWAQCYYRWMPLLDIVGGGQASVDLQTRVLTAKIAALRQGDTGAPAWDAGDAVARVGSFHPFSSGASYAGALANSTASLTSGYVGFEPMLDSQSLLNAPD